jgi:hypothetical protein
MMVVLGFGHKWEGSCEEEEEGGDEEVAADLWVAVDLWVERGLVDLEASLKEVEGNIWVGGWEGGGELRGKEGECERKTIEIRGDCTGGIS